MFTVECPGCKGSYQVDERRIPVTGLRMRCPKCSTAFVVDKPGAPREASSELDLPAQVEKSALPSPVVAPKSTVGKPVTPARSKADGAPLAAAPPRPAPPRPIAPTAPAPPTAPIAPTKLAIADDLLPAVSKQGRPPAAMPKPPERKGPPPAPSSVVKPVEPKPAPVVAKTEDEVIGLPETRRGPTMTKSEPKAAASHRFDDDLPLVKPTEGFGSTAQGNKQHAPTEPMLPIASRFGDFDSDSDLPAALGSNATNTEALSPKATSAYEWEDSLDIGLPGKIETAPLPRRASPLGIELDLPTYASKPGKAKPESVPPPVDDFEFELPSPVKAQRDAEFGLPDLSHGVALPERARQGAIDVGLPSVRDPGLPSVATTGVGLPSVPGASSVATKTLAGTGLSSTSRSANTPPAFASIPPTEIPELDLGWGNAPSSPPMTGGASGGSDSLPPIFGNPSVTGPKPSTMTLPSAVDMALPIDMPGVGGRRSSGSLPPVSGGEGAASLSAIGGTSYGEVSLDASEDVLSVETEADVGEARRTSSEALEFGTVPQPSVDSTNSALGDGGAPTPAASLQTFAKRETAKTQRTPRHSSYFIYAFLGLLVVGGASLTLIPDVGPFGAFFVADQFNRKENDALFRRAVEAGQVVLAKDDFAGVEPIIAEVERLRRTHERLKGLAAYAAYFSYSTELRHGLQSVVHSRAEVTLNELGERAQLPYYGLAQAARAAVDGNLARARRAVDAEVAREPRNVDALVLSAEIAILERRHLEALQQWAAAEKLAPSPRTAFGLARTLTALGRFDEAIVLAQKTQTRNATHVGAQLLLGRLALDVQHDADEAERRVQSALKLTTGASGNDFVQAKTLSGDVHLLRSRITLAETSYQEAIAKDPKSASALRGLGETLYRAGRYAEALARFEAGVQAAPDHVDAAVGVAKSQLALERIREAETLLVRLRQANPKNYSVNYWYARVSEAGGNRDEAEKAYETAIDLGGTDPIVVDAYVGLALVKNQQGRREEAQKVLAKALEKLPKLPRIYEAMGQLALAEGRYSAAVEQFKAALELNPSDVGVKFRMGVALRKNRDFDAAGKAFDDVAAVDRDYPGLALERGQLFEASGQTEEALRAFESALAKAPNDPDLMLRVGCGKVTAGRPEQAEELLKKVLEQRPSSAETHLCLGRAQLLEGSNLALALRTLQRAVELDPHRAEYLLYVGWAANEAGRVAEAEQALRKALELDQGLGDAYWQRGILRYRQGAVKDAVVDLTRALELRPGRYEAHAALADAYFDLGLESKALDEWQKASTAQPDNATWAFRYGKLLQAAHRDAEAKLALEKAIELSDKLTHKPRWLWEAHHLLARVLGLQPAAVKHWQKFLEFSPRDNVYREDAKAALSKLGQPWTGD